MYTDRTVKMKFTVAVAAIIFCEEHNNSSQNNNYRHIFLYFRFGIMLHNFFGRIYKVKEYRAFS